MRDGLNFSQDWVVDTSRIRNDLGFTEKVPRAEGLRRTIAWERANSPSPLDPTVFDYATEDEVLGTSWSRGPLGIGAKGLPFGSRVSEDSVFGSLS
jgi:hypothetical protein